MKRVIFFLSFCIWFAGCSRPTSENYSVVSFQTLNSQAAADAPAGKKFCYGANASGSGLATHPNTCGPKLSQFVGFVEGGASLSLQVEKGSGRSFQVFILLVDSAEACPEWNSSLWSNATYMHKLYSAGSVSDITLALENETVEIPVTFPGETQTLAQVTGQVGCNLNLKASLFSDGSIVDANGSLLTASHPAIESILSAPSSVLDLGIVSSGGMVNFSLANATPIAPQIYSLTRKPDTGILYGLLHSGQIVQVNLLAGSTSIYSELDASSCPFLVKDCQIPVWMQSISAGYGKNLFGLDHGGQIYIVNELSPIPIGLPVSPAVTQVSFY